MILANEAKNKMKANISLYTVVTITRCKQFWLLNSTM